MTVQAGMELGVEPDDEGVDESTETEGTDETEGGDAAGGKPEAKPAVKADQTKVLADLKSERDRRKNAEAELRRIRSEGATESEKATQVAVEETVTKFQTVLKRAAVKAVLAQSGAKDVDRMLKLVDLDTMDVDDDGNVSGYDGEIDSLKETYPELFNAAPVVGKVRAPRVDTGSGGGGGKAKSSAQRLAEALGGN